MPAYGRLRDNATALSSSALGVSSSISSSGGGGVRFLSSWRFLSFLMI